MKLQKLVLPLFFFLFFNYTTQSQNFSQYSISQLDSLLEVLKNERAYDKMLPIVELGVKKSLDKYGNQDTTYARMLYFMGLANYEMRNLAIAEENYSQAVAIQKAKIPKHPKYAQTLNSFGNLYSRMNKFDKAEAVFKESISVRKEIYGADSEDYANGLNGLGTLYYRMGKYRDTERLWKEMVGIYKKVLGNKHPSYAGSMNNLGALYFAIGRLEDAEVIYKESLLLRKELFGTKHPEYLNSLGNLGVLYTEMERYEEAEVVHKESIDLAEEIFGLESNEYSYRLNELASAYSYMNKYSEAEILYKKFNDIQKKINPKGEGYADGLNNLANLYFNLKRFDDSEALFLEALELRKKLFNTKHPDYVQSINNLGTFYRKIHKLKEAESFLKETMQLRKELYGEINHEYAMSLNNLAALYIETKQYDEALRYCQSAIIANGGTLIDLNINQTWMDSFVNQNYISLNSISESLLHLYNILKVDTTKEQKAKQVIVSETAILLLERNRHNMLNDKDKLRTLSESIGWALNALEVLNYDKDIDKAFSLFEQTKSILLLDAAKTARAYAFGDLPDSLAVEEQKLQNMQMDLNAALLEKIPAEEKKAINSMLNDLNIKIKQFKDNIEKKYPKYAKLKYDIQNTNTKEIQKLLDDKTALLEYLLEDSSVYIFYLDKKQAKLNRFFISKTILSNKIKDFHGVLSNYHFLANNNKEAYSQYAQLAHWFYENLLQKMIKNASPEIQNLIIVPDGELGYLPFETFLEEIAPQSLTPYSELKYIIKKYNISYNYSASLWKENKTAIKNKNNGQILAIASNYEASTNAMRLPAYQRLRKSLAPLSQARKEVELLMENFAGFLALDNNASERIFKEKAADYSIIHLAMHGLLDANEPILSSLAFTEDGDSLENNFLQAYEISKMKLNADLVVLSACETGYGKFEKGNGIASLARAFMYAGASSLVVSLWQVNDHSTAEIMKRFYQNLADGMTKNAALTQAKLDYIQNAQGIAAHPAFWSPFILIGNEEPIVLKTKSNSSIFLMIGGIVAALGICIFAMRKRKES